jgi:hypothetical protein
MKMSQYRDRTLQEKLYRLRLKWDEIRGVETDPNTLIDFEDSDLRWGWVGVLDGVRYTLPYNIYIVFGFLSYLIVAAIL